MPKMNWNSDALRACDKMAADFHSGLGDTMASLACDVLNIGRRGGDESHDDVMQRLYARTRRWTNEDRNAAFEAVRSLLMAPINGTAEQEKAEEAKAS